MATPIHAGRAIISYFDPRAPDIEIIEFGTLGSPVGTKLLTLCKLTRVTVDKLMTARLCTLRIMIAASLTVFAAQSAFADSIIELGIHFGGGELIYETYDNGDKDSMKAGELFSFDFGRLWQLTPSWETQLTFGVKSDAIYDNNLDISWVRYPFNGLVFYRMSKFRTGLGITYHLSPELKGSGLGEKNNEKYKDAVGGLFEVDFIYSEKFLWGIRLTFIEYQSQKDAHVVDGNSIGFLIIAQL